VNIHAIPICQTENGSARRSLKTTPQWPAISRLPTIALYTLSFYSTPQFKIQTFFHAIPIQKSGCHSTKRVVACVLSINILNFLSIIYVHRTVFIATGWPACHVTWANHYPLPIIIRITCQVNNNLTL